MIFNVNDFFHSQMFHLVVTHDVSEAVHQAALHTLSERHPVMGYSSRVVGEKLCFDEGGHWDKRFYVNNKGCRKYVSNNWPTHGKYQAGYLETDFQARGLINKDGKSPFKSFPFFQDALEIRKTYQAFFASFVDSYYSHDSDVKKDTELQNWIKEATKADVQDFPSELDKKSLVEVLTHFGFIVSVVHHGLNGGDPMGSKATLPFHLPALYAPLPKEKGVTDLMPFLPPPMEAVQLIGFLASFNRPFYQTQKTKRTMEYAFDEDEDTTHQLKRLNDKTKEAAKKFSRRA
ncbi:Uu.00g045160.m01.CDS01 [Anthostomella pinea]|uniref:Manganese lipoxygenase n=1 Tax=Anthostomella pinea TaxID=933095 RepID=A0AAI8YEI3_9PEZI|nr:Uu.00g045160.m01.CDS01 [Anthostomella pinea]